MSTPIDPFTDPYGYMGLSITRTPNYFPTTPASSDPRNPVLTKDVPINHENGTWGRVYLPRDASSTSKLPLIVYFHGGGFVLHSAASSVFQKFCNDIVMKIPAVMVSVEYHLAPEHRLPTAYDDCLEALRWIRTSSDEWLTKYVDLSRCFLMGSSAGGNIVLRLGLDASACVDQLTPLKIGGLILHQAFFGGVERTSSEIRLAKDKMVPPHLNDIIWSLSLPIGVDRDHEYSNPIKNIRVVELEWMKKEGWKFLVTGDSGDPLVDRLVEAAKVLKENGVDVTEMFRDGGSHGIDFYDEERASIFYGVLKNFLLTC